MSFVPPTVTLLKLAVAPAAIVSVPEPVVVTGPVVLWLIIGAEIVAEAPEATSNSVPVLAGISILSLGVEPANE